MKQFYIFNYRAVAVWQMLIILFSFHAGFAQTLLNGDFENNTAGTDKINNPNALFNSYMADVHAFGTDGNMDIITDATYCGLPEHGLWYVAFTGGGTDAIALTLSAALDSGSSYTISFWDRGCTPYTSFPFQFGLSYVDSTYGDIIYTEPTTSIEGVWTQHIFTFSAPNNGQYLTVHGTTGTTSYWSQMDNVQFVSSGTPVVSDILASDTLFCQNNCISFTDRSANNPTRWNWTFTGAVTDTSTMQNPSGICYPEAGYFPVTLRAANAFGGDTLTIANYIHVIASPPPPTIIQYHDTLVCTANPDYTTYQWYADTSLIQGDTDSLLVVSQGGNYNVKVTNVNGCSIAVGINIIISGINTFSADEYIWFFPNPAVNLLAIHSSSPHVNEMVTLSIMNVLGETLQQEKLMWSSDESININNLAAGMYFLQMKTESGSFVKRFVKE